MLRDSVNAGRGMICGSPIHLTTRSRKGKVTRQVVRTCQLPIGHECRHHDYAKFFKSEAPAEGRDTDKAFDPERRQFNVKKFSKTVAGKIAEHETRPYHAPDRERVFVSVRSQRPSQ